MNCYHLLSQLVHAQRLGEYIGSVIFLLPRHQASQDTEFVLLMTLIETNKACGFHLQPNVQFLTGLVLRTTKY